MIGVAISTYRRPEILRRALSGWAGNLGGAQILVVNHDLLGEGVAATKNKGISELMAAGCDHLFLADDDCWPISPQWHRFYLESPEPHLMHCWGKSRAAGIDNRHGPGQHLSVWTWPRGPLLYVTRQVIEKVGGMRLEFGQWGGEHAEWSRRIHNAGFTAHEFQDVVAAARGIWHCEDYTRATPSSVPKQVRDDPELGLIRHKLYSQYWTSTEFVPYE